MKKSVIIFLFVLLAACSGEKKFTEESKVSSLRTFPPPSEANSAFGEIEITEDSLTLSPTTNSAAPLLSIIKKRLADTRNKQFFLIDLQSLEKKDSNQVAEIIDTSLKNKNLNYEIQIKSGGRENAPQSVMVKLRSVFIKPRNCSPDKKAILESVGGYYEAKFGCSYANNLAAMIDNPRDVVAPRGSLPVDTTRTIRVIRAYLEGTETSAAIPGNEAGEVSAVSASE
jgi:pilus biogenesis lipoprotein CpaD